MKQRIITALSLIAVIVPPIFLGGIYLDILLAFFGLAVIYEFMKVAGYKKYLPLSLLLVTYVFFNIFISYDWFIETSSLLIMILYLINVINNDFNVEKIAYIFMFSFFTIAVLKAFIDIYSVSLLIIVYLLLITYLTDTFAYFGGMLFGKHKLNERISPKKTIEGSIVGYFGGAGSGLIFGLYFLDLPYVLIIAGCLLIPIFSQLGDLAMSSVKRYFDCKDFSNIFPGHGGVLDRIDSLTFSLLVFNILMRMMM